MKGLNPNEPNRGELTISKIPDWRLFERVAARIEARLDGEWVERVDGLDQRYWDFRNGKAIITLHLEHHVGIVAYVAHDAEDVAASELLLGAVETVVEEVRGNRPSWPCC